MSQFLITNRISGKQIRNVTHRGTEYLVADVTAAKAMYLNGGYVPAEEWQESAPEWSGVPLPVGHPVDQNGEPITARVPEVAENSVVGRFYYPRFDDSNDSLEGELWVDTNRARELGGLHEDVVEILENGEPLEVSTAYRAEEAEPGVYDGEHREDVVTNIRPDHLALLPGDLGPGKCSVEDGCGTGDQRATASANAEHLKEGVETLSTHTDTMVANAAGYEVDGTAGDNAQSVYLNMQINVLETARTPNYDGVSSDEEWDRPSFEAYLNAYYSHTDAEQPDDPPSSVGELSEDARGWIASKSLLGDPETDSYEELVMFPVVRPSDDQLSEAALNAVLSRIGSADISDEAAESVREQARTLLEDEFDREFTDENDDESEADADPDTTDDDADSDSADEDQTAPETNEQNDESVTPAEAEEATTLFRRFLESIGISPDEAGAGETETTATNVETEADTDTDCDCANTESESECACDDHGPDVANETDDDDPESEPSEDDGDDGPSGESGEGTDTPDESGDDSDDPTDPDADDDPDASVSDDESPDTTDDSDDETDSDDSDGSTTETMPDFDYEAIASETGISVEELKEMDDERLENLEDLVTRADAPEDEEPADDDGEPADDGGDPDGGDEASPDDSDSDSDGSDDDSDDESEVDGSVSMDEVDTDAIASAVADEVDQRVEARVDEMLEERGVDEMAANHRERKQTKRQQLKNTILSNSSEYTEDDLDQMGESLLEKTANVVSPPNGTDYGARHPGSAGVGAANASASGSSDDEESDGPATAGTMSDFMENAD